MNLLMGIQGISRQPANEPKASCPSCRRPVAVLKTGRCSYCGAPLPGALHVVGSTPGLPPELLLSLQPRTPQVSKRTRWIRRLIGLGVASLLVAAIMGPCMKS
jgi:hypothetical protein